MPCTDEKCNSPEAYAEEQLDANHCINGCPLEALQRETWIAEHVDTTEPDALETFIARHPLRATASMKAAYTDSLRTMPDWLQRRPWLPIARVIEDNVPWRLSLLNISYSI